MLIAEGRGENLMGFAQCGYQMIDEWLALAGRMVRECPCETGCPSCVGLPNLRPPIHQDPDVSGGWPIPSKQAAKILLREILRK